MVLALALASGPMALALALAHVGLPVVRFLTGQSGFLGKCPVRIFSPKRIIQCPVFWLSIVIFH